MQIFTFDDAFWSERLQPGSNEGLGCGFPTQIATQADIFESIGIPFLNNAFDGYNSSIFTYGQTGSGKTHTMMGSPGDEGVRTAIPQYL